MVYIYKLKEDGDEIMVLFIYSRLEDWESNSVYIV